MRHLRLSALVMLALCLLVSCQGSLQNVQRDQEAKVALMHERERSILAECELKRVRGELKTYAASTECSNAVIIKAHQDAGDPAMNFVYLLTAYRLAVAERMDKGVLNHTQGNLMLAQLVSRINTERLQRDMQTTQRKNVPDGSYESLLQGLAVWKGSANPPTQGDAKGIGEPAPESLPDQQDRETSITCFPVGDRITCH